MSERTFSEGKPFDPERREHRSVTRDERAAQVTRIAHRVFPAHLVDDFDGTALGDFYYNETERRNAVRDLLSDLEKNGHIVDHAEGGIFEVTLHTGETVRFVPEPVPDNIRILEEQLQEQKDGAFAAMKHRYDFYSEHGTFFRSHGIFPPVPFVEAGAAATFGITEPGDIALFEQLAACSANERTPVLRAQELKEKINIHEIQPDLESVFQCDDAAAMTDVVERMNVAHPDGFPAYRYAIIRTFDGGVVAIGPDARLHISSDDRAFERDREQDTSLTVIQRLPRVVDDAPLHEGALTDAMVRGASKDLLRVFERSMNARKPIHVTYGLGEDCGKAVSDERCFLWFSDDRGRELGRMNWYYKEKKGGLKVMEAGLFALEEPFRKKGGGRNLVEMKKRFANELGYDAMEICIDNEGFWAKMFSEEGGVPLNVTQSALARMRKGELEATEFGSWKYMKDSNTIQNRWRYAFEKEGVGAG